jgi:hypothetical protein
MAIDVVDLRDDEHDGTFPRLSATRLPNPLPPCKTLAPQVHLAWWPGLCFGLVAGGRVRSGKFLCRIGGHQRSDHLHQGCRGLHPLELSTETGVLFACYCFSQLAGRFINWAPEAKKANCIVAHSATGRGYGTTQEEQTRFGHTYICTQIVSRQPTHTHTHTHDTPTLLL